MRLDFFPKLCYYILFTNSDSFVCDTREFTPERGEQYMERLAMICTLKTVIEGLFELAVDVAQGITKDLVAIVGDAIVNLMSLLGEEDRRIVIRRLQNLPPQS